MKILTSEQIHEWDLFTIAQEPITSLQLMERASATFSNWFETKFKTEKTVFIFCGTGNNGGDGLAIARLLHQKFYNVHVFITKISQKETDEFTENLKLLPNRADILKGYIEDGNEFTDIPEDAIIIDAMLGSGLSRPIWGYWADFFDYLNNKINQIVSVDIPSGVFTDRHTEGACIHADYVFSFETPKLAFLLPENKNYIKSFVYQTIGLPEEFLETATSDHIYITEKYVASILKKRSKFDHKGVFGHALIVAGSFGMAGAAILAGRSCLRSGVGLLTVHAPQCNRIILQTTVPEAIIRADADEFVIAQNTDSDAYKVIGIGCGIGKAGRTASALKNYLINCRKPFVLDADALNIISDNTEMLDLIPKNSVLTPHIKEFERLFGRTTNDFEQLELLKNKAKTLKINILLKGAHTVIANTEGVCFFNSTGNPGMATAGSGDVLTGIITGLIAQGYEPFKAAILATYIHGLAGDIAAQKRGYEALLATDIIDNMSEAWKILHEN